MYQKANTFSIYLISVVKPYDAKKYITRKTMTGCATLITFLFTAFNGYIVLVEIYTKTLPSGSLYCGYPDNVIADLSQFLIGQIPLLILIPSNALIIIKISYQRKKWHNLDNAQKKEQKKSFKLTLMILALTVSFIFLTIPWPIYWMFLNKPGTKDNLKLRNILSTFAFTNAGINFYLYFLSSEGYRKAVKKQLIDLFQMFCVFGGRVEPASQTSDIDVASNFQKCKSKNVTISTIFAQKGKGVKESLSQDG